jgi:hypothetical protein
MSIDKTMFLFSDCCAATMTGGHAMASAKVQLSHGMKAHQ